MSSCIFIISFWTLLNEPRNFLISQDNVYIFAFLYHDWTQIHRTGIVYLIVVTRFLESFPATI
jgi:hypothetical protein